MTAEEDLLSGLNVSRETMAGLHTFEALVRRWTPAINLISKSTIDQIWTRHILDSSQLYPLASPNARIWADFGSGAGFPGLVVALLAKERNPSLRVILVEADARKATFLREASRTLELETTVITDRIERLPPLGADIVSARALTQLVGLLSYAEHHLGPQGIALFMKGENLDNELCAARDTWAFNLEILPSATEPRASILKVGNIRRTSK